MKYLQSKTKEKSESKELFKTAQRIVVLSVCLYFHEEILFLRFSLGFFLISETSVILKLAYNPQVILHMDH